MEADDSVHPDNVGDEEVGQHDVESDVAKLFVVASQVSVQTAVNVPEVLDRLKHHLYIVLETRQKVTRRK